MRSSKISSAKRQPGRTQGCSPVVAVRSMQKRMAHHGCRHIQTGEEKHGTGHLFVNKSGSAFFESKQCQQKNVLHILILLPFFESTNKKIKCVRERAP